MCPHYIWLTLHRSGNSHSPNLEEGIVPAQERYHGNMDSWVFWYSMLFAVILFFPPKFIIYLTYIYVSVLVFLKDRCQRGTRQISSGKLLSWPHGPGFLALAKPNPLHCTPSKETNFHPLRIIEPGSFTPADELPHDCPRSQMCISQQQSPGILAKI